MDSEQKRVCLWAAPRSLSTVMCRVMLNSPYKTQVLFEPYSRPYFLGPDREPTLYEHVEHSETLSEFTFDKARNSLLLPYEGKELVFAKMIARQMTGRITEEWMPKGYTHTFIIRHPTCTVASLAKVIGDTRPGQGRSDYTECGFKTLVQVYRLLLKLGHKVVIFDADDLMENPERTLKLFCQEIGLKYSDNMVNWKPLTEEERAMFQAEIWEDAWFNSALNSTSIQRRPKQNNRGNLLDAIKDSRTRNEVEKVVNENLKYYEELYAERLKV